MMHAESPRYSAMEYSEEKIYNLAQTLLNNPQVGGILVAEVDKQVVGMFAFVVSEQFFGPERMASDLAVYLAPEHRGGSLFARLVIAFEKWADELGVARKVVGVSTGLHTEVTVGAFERLGYKGFSTGLEKV